MEIELWRDVPLLFAKKKKSIMSLRGLELQNELLKGVNLIIVNYHGRKQIKAK